MIAFSLPHISIFPSRERFFPESNELFSLVCVATFASSDKFSFRSSCFALIITNDAECYQLKAKIAVESRCVSWDCWRSLRTRDEYRL